MDDLLEGGMHVLMLLVMGYREPALTSPVFDDRKACVAAGKEAEKRFRVKRTGQAGNVDVAWFCAPQSSDPRRE